MAEERLEERMARVEGILEQMDKRLNHIDSDLGSFRSEMTNQIGGLRGEMGELRSETSNQITGLRGEMDGLRSQIRSVYNLIIIMWVTIIFGLGGLYATIVFR